MPTSDSEDDIPSNNQKDTEGTQILLADPKAAILRLSLPMMVAMTLMTLYNVVDAFWVSGPVPMLLLLSGSHSRSSSSPSG